MSRREARKSLLIKATTGGNSTAAPTSTTGQRGQLESLNRGKQQLHGIVGTSLFYFGKEAAPAAAADALADAVLGEIDLSRVEFVFRLASADTAFVTEVRATRFQRLFFFFFFFFFVVVVVVDFRPMNVDFIQQNAF
jgi:hypothetical protein